MDLNQLKPSLDQYLATVSQSITVDQVIIFGSQVAGKAAPDSDIDVLVVSDDFKRLDEGQRFDILHPARLNIEPNIDPWGFTSDELANLSPLSIFGSARDRGIRFI
jgi:predicted nucleotidyltransferase